MTGGVERKQRDWERADCARDFITGSDPPGSDVLFSEMPLGHRVYGNWTWSCWGLKEFGVHCRLYGSQAPRSTTKLSEQLQETRAPRAGRGCISKEMSTEASVLTLAPGCLWESLPLWEHPGPPYQFHTAYNWILWGPDSFTYRNLCCVGINKRSQSSKTLNYLNLFSATHRLQCSVLKQNWEYFSSFLSYTLSY